MESILDSLNNDDSNKNNEAGSHLEESHSEDEGQKHSDIPLSGGVIPKAVTVNAESSSVPENLTSDVDEEEEVQKKEDIQRDN